MTQGRMAGRKAIVVGAGQPPSDLVGNGRAIATLLAREGAEVCAIDRDADRAAATVAAIAAEGGTAHAIVADVGLPEDCARLVREGADAMGGVDALVNNVATNHGDADPLGLEVEAWDRLFDINLRSMWLTSRTVVPIMRAQGRGGTIVNISTLGSHSLGGRLFGYAISKAGVNALTRFFAVSYAGDGIRCNVVLPAWVMTPHSLEGLTRHGLMADREEMAARGARMNPLHRMGDAHDVANAVLYLSSEESRHTTGLEVPVDGGTINIVGRYERRD